MKSERAAWLAPAVRPLAAALLLAVGIPAWADWTRIYEDEEVVGYIDLTTIKTVNENVRRVSELLDLKRADPQFKDEWSHRFLVEYNCKERLVRVVSVTGYSERMARGRITNSAKPKPKWAQIGPRSHHVKQLKIVCAG
jgi:hypothetical protein